MATQTVTPTTTAPATKMSVDDFANSIKAKYPAYKDIDNATLAQKIIAKYPVYGDRVNINTSNLGGPPSENQQAQDKYKSTFQADPNGSAVGEAAKVVGNLPSSAFGMAKGVVDLVNPVSTFKKLDEIGGAIIGLNSDKKAEAQGNQNVSDQNNKLIEQYKTMRAAGKDTSHLEAFAKQNGIDLSKVQVAAPTKGAFASAVNEAPGAAVTTLVPEAGRATGRVIQGYVTGNDKMIDENLQRAERAIVDDPVGQILPFILATEGGAKALDKAGITSDAAGAVDRTISTVGQGGIKALDTVTKPVQYAFGKMGDAANFAKDAAAYTARSMTGLNKPTVEEFAKDPNLKPVDAEGLANKRTDLGSQISDALAEKKTALGVTPESLGQEVQSSIGKRIGDLEDTGKGYGPIREGNTPVKVAPNFLAQTLKGNTGLEIEDGQLKTSGSASIRDPKDVRALQNLYDTWQPTFQKGTITPSEFLNFRSDLAKIAKFDREITSSQPLENLSAIMRGKFNTQFRGNIPGLEELDTKFSTATGELKSLSKGLVDKNGNLTDAGLSKIAKATADKPALIAQLEQVSPGITAKIAAMQELQDLGKGIVDSEGNITDAGLKKITNATNESNPGMLARLEEIKPGITKAIKQYKALQDVEAVAGKFKVGTYAKTIGAGGLIAGLMTMNPLMIGGAIAEMILTSPENAIKVIQTYAKTKPIIDAVVTKLKTGVSSTLDAVNNIPNRTPKILQKDVSEIPVGLSVKDVGSITGPLRDSVANTLKEALPKIQNMVNSREVSMTEWSRMQEISDKIEKGVEKQGDLKYAYQFLKDYGMDPSKTPAQRVGFASKPVKDPSIESTIESAGGWEPGMRQKFDEALMHKDAKTVQELLPKVPAEYKARFSKEITQLLQPVGAFSKR